MQLNGKTAIVTGASSGIGADFSEKLIEKGCRVYGIARRVERLEQLQARLGSLFVPVAMDMTQYDLLEQWVAESFLKPDHDSSSHANDPPDSELKTNNEGMVPGAPDILINNAGLGFFGPVDELPPEQWDTMIETNLTSIFRLTRLIVPLMKSSAFTSHIVNIASVAGLIGNPNISGYNATKFALRGFSEALMKELRNHKIKVTCIYPGSIATSFFDQHGGTHDNMLRGKDVADTLIHVLETPDNFLIDEITVRPLIPKPPQ